MFHVVFSLASRLLYLGNMLQGFTRGILALRSLHIISSHLILTISPPPPTPAIDAPTAFAGLPQTIISPLPFKQRPSQAFSSSIPGYQSSLIAVMPNYLPNILLVFITASTISGLVFLLYRIVYFRPQSISKLVPAGPLFRFITSLSSISVVSFLIFWTGPPAIASMFIVIWIISILLSCEEVPNVIVTFLQRCSLLVLRDTRTPPILDTIYEQITRYVNGYDDLIAQVDTSEGHYKGQIIPGSCLGYSHLATQLRDHEYGLRDARMRKEKQEQEERAKKLQLEKCRLLVQRMYAKFVHARNTLRHQLQVSRAREQELHANLLATEQERDKLKDLVSTLEMSDKKQRGNTTAAEARCLEVRMTALRLRAGLTVATSRTRAVQERLDNQTRLASGKDLFSQSIAEDSHVLHANLKGAEQEIACLNVELQQERERFKVLVSILEASDKERREWEETTAAADARCSEAETAAFNLRADLATAMAQARIVEEQLGHQREVASGKDLIIQSIAEESQVLHTKLKDEIARLDAELRHEHDRRLHETKELLDEQVRIRGCHEVEVHSIALQARDAQEQLVALRDFLFQSRLGAQPDRVHLHPPAYRPSTTGLVDTGQLLLLPERILGLSAPGISVLSAFDPNPPLISTASSLPCPPPRDTDDPSIRQAGHLYRISGSFDQASDVAKSQQAALQELLQRMLQQESESTQVVNPNEHDDKCLQLRLAGEEYLHVRRNLEQFRETLREVETHARGVMHELDMCRVKLREEQDARRSLRFKLDEAAELLRLRSAELESSKVEAEMSHFKCSQITFLSVALQERVTELEAELKTLKSTPKYSALSSAHDDSSRVADADTVLEAITNNADFPVSDSIYMTVPPSLPCLLDLSLPPLSSQCSHSSLYFSQQKFSMTPACVNSRLVFPENMDFDVMTHDANTQIWDSISISLLSCPPADSSVPPSSSQSSDIARLNLPAHTDYEVLTYNADSQITDSFSISLPPSMPYLLDSSLPPPWSQLSDITYSVLPTHTNDEAIVHNADSQISHSIFISPPSSVPRPFDSSRPPSSLDSRSSDISVAVNTLSDESEASPHAIVDPDHINEESINFYPTHNPSPSPTDAFSPHPSILPRTFLSERSGVDSVDWPPTGSALISTEENVRQGDGVCVQENADSSVLPRATQPTPLQKSNEHSRDHASAVTSIISYTSLDRSLAQFSAQRHVVLDDHPEAEPLPQTNIDGPPILTPPSLSLLAHPPSGHQANVVPVLTLDEVTNLPWQVCHEITHHSTSLASRAAPLRSLQFPQPPRMKDTVRLDYPRVSLPPFSLPPSAMYQTLERPPAFFLSRLNDDDIIVGDLSPVPLGSNLSGSVQSGERYAIDHDNIEMDYDGTLPAVTHLSARNHDNCRAAPAQRVSSLLFNTTCPGGDLSRLNSPSSLSLPAHPSLRSFKDLPSALNRQEVRRPSEIMILRPDRQVGQGVEQDSLPFATSRLETCGGTSVISGRLGSVLGSRHSGYCACPLLRNRFTSMQSSKRASLPQSSDVFTSQQNFAHVASPSPPHYSPASGTYANDASILDYREALLSSRYQDRPSNPAPPLPTRPSAPVVSLSRKGTESGPANSKRITEADLQPSISPLLPGLLCSPNISSDELALREGDSHYATQRSQKGRRAKRCRHFSRPPDISMLDYGLPEDFVPSPQPFTPERLDPELDDFAFIIPSDCPTSTPVASGKRDLKGHQLTPAEAALTCVKHSPPGIFAPPRTRRPLGDSPSPGINQDLRERKAPRSGEEPTSAHGEIVYYPPDPIFDFFGI